MTRDDAIRHLKGQVNALLSEVERRERDMHHAPVTLHTNSRFFRELRRAVRLVDAPRAYRDAFAGSPKADPGVNADLDEPEIFTSGRELPPHLRRELAPTRPCLADPLSRRLALLLQLHPDVDRRYPDVDLRRLTWTERKAMLEAIEKLLGIRAIAGKTADCSTDDPRPSSGFDTDHAEWKG